MTAWAVFARARIVSIQVPIALAPSAAPLPPATVFSASRLIAYSEDALALAAIALILIVLAAAVALVLIVRSSLALGLAAKVGFVLAQVVNLVTRTASQKLPSTALSLFIAR